MMKEVPEPVRSKFSELRRNYAFPIVLRRINDHYYVYKQISKRNKELNKTEIVETEYLGKITPIGVFVVKGIKNPENEIEVAKAVILAHGGKVVMPQIDEGRAYETESGDHYTELDMKILKNLTMNGRMPTSFMARKLGVEEKRVENRIARMEKELGIRYTPHIKLEKLGFIDFLVFVKFFERKPNPEKVKADLSKIPQIQFAAFTNGKYDMILHIVAESNNDFSIILGRVRNLDSLVNITSRWYATNFNATKGFIPLRDEIFEVLREKVWSRTRESPRPAESQLLKSEYWVLKELNNNGAAPFAEMERKGNLAKGSAKHAYDRLKEKDIIKRVSITCGKLRIKYNAVIIIEIKNQKAFWNSRERFLEYILEERSTAYTDRFALTGDINMPEGVIFIMPVFSEGDAGMVVEELTKVVYGINVYQLIITEVLLGHVPYRKFDETYSSQYERLIALYKKEQKKQEDYGP
ncbi:AsnC family transcriptional regulator [Candidatus Marsarchaeota archaeon]|jgi:DNA-binding Lrp family transcriptional regulator|nr:AsnC family transcriptional regulator [Candidatus Marsarchaeota archaeon]